MQNRQIAILGNVNFGGGLRVCVYGCLWLLVICFSCWFLEEGWTPQYTSLTLSRLHQCSFHTLVKLDAIPWATVVYILCRQTSRDWSRQVLKLPPVLFCVKLLCRGILHVGIANERYLFPSDFILLPYMHWFDTLVLLEAVAVFRHL